MNTARTLYRKELSSYLFSPIAFIFIGTFLLVSLFTFFWVDQFFERNIADLRPLFHWLPVLLIFLVSTLTMKSWAEEKSQGTFELLMTWPSRAVDLVLGKFLGVMGLVVIALVLTTPLVFTVAFLGDLDFGPVVCGYLGALFLASAYTAMGLWISSNAKNQIIALIGTGVLGGFFFMLGSPTTTHLLPQGISELFRLLGTGSRFESVSRGVLDIRDIAYYLSLTVGFGLLNVFSLLRSRWSLEKPTPAHRKMFMTVILVLANVVLLNVWLAPITQLRLDLTSRREYSISSATKSVLAELKEPLEIRFYSNETHPLLDPLRPQVRDLIKEFEIVSRGKVKSSFIDPTTQAEAEKEANEIYGIKPVPFRIPSRNEMKIVNSYFNILLKYGDQNVVLGFDDLIEVSVSGMGEIQVKLRNLEYDLTKSIKKVVQGFQNSEDLFAAVADPIRAKILVTEKTLPPSLKEGFEKMKTVYAEIAKTSGGKFSFEIVDLDEAGASVSRDRATKEWGIKPFATSVLSESTFFFHTVLFYGPQGAKREIIYPTGDLSEKDLKNAIEGFVKRQAKGFLKTVGLWTPPPSPAEMMQQRMMQPGSGGQYRLLNEVLSQDYQVKNIDLKSGHVDRDVDILFLVKPKQFSPLEQFAIDQFLMQGGNVILASGSFEMKTAPGGGVSLEPLQQGLSDLSEFYGIGIEKSVVMDLQNEPFPIPVTRDLGGFQVQEMQLLRYPFFVDIRQNGMAKDQVALAALPSITLHFSSPLKISSGEKNQGRFTTLLHSSAKSWTSTSTDIQPNLTLYPDFGFKPSEDFSPSVLAAVAQGPFESYFKDKPVLGADPQMVTSMVKESPKESRWIVVGSGDFLSDTVLGISQQTGQERYVNNLDFAKNLIDWTLQDTSLLSIRSRGSFARTLRPNVTVFGYTIAELNPTVKNSIEIANYLGVVALLMGLLFLMHRQKRSVRPLVLVKNKSTLGVSFEEKAA